jgi:hypothetical protein
MIGALCSRALRQVGEKWALKHVPCKPEQASLPFEKDSLLFF